MGSNEQLSDNTTTAKVRILPPLVFLGWFIAAIIVTRLGGLWITYALSRLRTFLGAIFLLGGIALVLHSIRFMRETGQNPSPKKPTPTLITTGPWRYTRNPIYLGMTAAQVGLGLSLNNVYVIASGLLALMTVHRTAVLPEEAYLTTRFGDAYRDYQRKVRRYL